MSDDQTTTFDAVCSVIKATFPAARDVTITPGSTSDDVDGWDSLSYSVLIMNVEDRFQIELPFEEIYELPNVGALAHLVERSMPGNG